MDVKALYRQEQFDVKLWRERERERKRLDPCGFSFLSLSLSRVGVCGEAYMLLASLFLLSQEGGENPLSLIS